MLSNPDCATLRAVPAPNSVVALGYFPWPEPGEIERLTADDSPSTCATRPGYGNPFHNSRPTWNCALHAIRSRRAARHLRRVEIRRRAVVMPRTQTQFGVLERSPLRTPKPVQAVPIQAVVEGGAESEAVPGPSRCHIPSSGGDRGGHRLGTTREGTAACSREVELIRLIATLLAVDFAIAAYVYAWVAWEVGMRSKPNHY